MSGFSPDDLAAVREQGDLAAFFAAITGKPAPRPEVPVEDDEPDFHVAHPGAWPCGTSATGPIPGPHCPACTPPDEPHRHLTPVPDTPDAETTRSAA